MKTFVRTFIICVFVCITLGVAYVVAYLGIVSGDKFEGFESFVEALFVTIFWGSMLWGIPALLFCIGMALIASLMEKMDKKKSPNKIK